MKLALKWILAITLALVCVAPPVAADKQPERQVKRTTITSSHDPAVKITLPKAAKYLGAARWDLYNCCDAELHVFVEADAQKRVQRLYWVQFEGYLPNNTYTYDYPFTETTVHGGRRFDVNASFGPTNQPVRAGSDFERVRALISQAGFQLPAETMSVRLVDVLDAAKRKELMFIYSEDLAASGASAQELSTPDGKAKWEQLKSGLIERAKQRIRVQFRPPEGDVTH